MPCAAAQAKRATCSECVLAMSHFIAIVVCPTAKMFAMKSAMYRNLMQTTAFESLCLMRCTMLLQLAQLAVEHSSVKPSSLAALLHMSLRLDVRSKSSSASGTTEQALSWWKSHHGASWARKLEADTAVLVADLLLAQEEWHKLIHLWEQQCFQDNEVMRNLPLLLLAIVFASCCMYAENSPKLNGLGSAGDAVLSFLCEWTCALCIHLIKLMCLSLNMSSTFTR